MSTSENGGWLGAGWIVPTPPGPLAKIPGPGDEKIAPDHWFGLTDEPGYGVASDQF